MENKEILLRAKEFIKPDYFTYFEQYCEKYNVNTALRISHFLAQVTHESGDMKYIEENLNYSANRLIQVFPKYFKTLEEAKKYEHKPEKIANKVYANRMGNGDEVSGDGWKYRGRGLLQLTGKNNYKNFGIWLGVDDLFVRKPDLIKENKDYTVLSAFYYWDTHGLNSYVIENAGLYDVCKKITKAINGGYNGLNDRWQRFQKIYNKIIS